MKPQSPTKDLRSFLALVEESHDLKRVKKPVGLDQEPTALITWMAERGESPAFLFEKVGDSQIPLAMNVQATRERMALALGVSPEKLNATYQERIQNPIPPVVVESGPVQEVILTGDQVDLSVLPIITPSANTTAPYMGGGILTARDPISGYRNLSYNRLMVTGKNRMGFHAAPGLHLHAILERAIARREELPVAIILGYHPTFALGSLAKVPFGVEEYACAGGLMEEPVQLVRGQTVPLEVPAYAEIVIEGKVLLDVEQPEGPYDEFSGYALAATMCPVIEVTAITHRRNPIFQDIMGGGVEHVLLGALPKAASLETRLHAAHSSVKAVHYPLSGCGRLHAVISVENANAHEVRRILLSAFSMDHFLKHVWAVDHDVDIFSDRDVFWAMSTCFQAHRDMLVLERMLGSSLDPSSDDCTGTKLGFDCTRKGTFPPRNAISEEILQKMSPEKY